jgi:hypothetical protein
MRGCRLWLLWACLTAPACYSLSLMQEPKPLAPGRVRGSVGFGWNLERLPAPSLHTGLRVGVLPHVEARVKASWIGSGAPLQSLQSGLTLELYEDTLQSVVLMPYYRYDPALLEDADELLDEAPEHRRRVHAFALPALYVRHGSTSHVFIGPELQAGARDGHGFFAAGAHLGVSTGRGGQAYFTPELSLLYVLAGQASDARASQSVLRLHDFLLELGVSLTFGSRN